MISSKLMKQTNEVLSNTLQCFCGMILLDQQDTYFEFATSSKHEYFIKSMFGQPFKRAKKTRFIYSDPTF